MKLINICACFLIFFVVGSNSLKILGVFPTISKSHFTIGQGIVDALHDAGHDITVMSPFPQKKPKERFRDVDFSEVRNKYQKEMNINAFDFGKMSAVNTIDWLFKTDLSDIDATLNYESVQKLLKSKEKFDVCIVELFFIDTYMALAEHHDCILIGFTTFGAVGMIDEITGNVSPTSYVPMVVLGYTDKMTFAERYWNTLYSLYERITFHGVGIPRQDSFYEKHFPNAKKPYFEMFQSPAIIFQNSHVSTSYPRPYLPSVIEIGGIHVKPAKPLPNDLQEFLDSAVDGAILFSMGSFLQSKNFPAEKLNVFLNVFETLQQKVLWKFEEDLPNKSKNVKISSWLPQRDILAHKNVKVFITHGGSLSTTEAIYEGVPILGIPIYGDQKMNINNAVAKGYGIDVHFDDITEEKIQSALMELLHNPKYFETAKSLSKVFKDRPMTPQQSVVYWTEYAYRHKGAEHLKSAGRDLYFFQLISFDVYFALFLSLIATLLIAIFICVYLCRIFCCKSPNNKPPTTKQKKKKN
ncbi:UDP-glycosyltransferase UGT5-like [Chironomus tepperi]|uniref:UDP-glycosyltransferase UGT5-like n=1 Tax=Chironomus tepperi TaxID=113505 RepID=UPI00391F090B